jgi:hypothetical protein
MRKLSRKSKIVAAGAALALTGLGGGVAFAYWSTTGTGSGTGTNSAGGGHVELTASFAGGLAPGGSQPIAYAGTNTSSSSTVVGALSAVVTTNVGGCLPEWFTATAATSGTTLAAGASGSVGSGTLTFIDLPGTDQDACKSAVVKVSVASL